MTISSLNISIIQFGEIIVSYFIKKKISEGLTFQNGILQGKFKKFNNSSNFILKIFFFILKFFRKQFFFKNLLISLKKFYQKIYIC